MMMCEACFKFIPEHEVSGKMVRTRPHEIRSRGAGGECVKENQLVLCLKCHQDYHQKGKIAFIERFPFLGNKIKKALNK